MRSHDLRLSLKPATVKTSSGGGVGPSPILNDNLKATTTILPLIIWRVEAPTFAFNANEKGD